MTMKFSQLLVGSALAGTEILPMVQSAVNYYTTPLAIKTYILGQAANNFTGSGSFAGLTTSVAATLATGVPQYSQVQNSASARLSSVSGTNTITGALTPAITTYASGQIFTLVPVNTNSGATTLNINGLGPKSVFAYGAACVGFEILSGVPLQVEYDGTQFNILGPCSQKYIAASANCINAITTAAIWKLSRAGQGVILTLPQTIGTAGGSNASFSYGTAIPAAFRPAADIAFNGALIQNNGAVVNQPGVVFITASTGVITVQRDGTLTAFTNSAIAGLQNSLSVGWTL